MAPTSASLIFEVEWTTTSAMGPPLAAAVAAALQVLTMSSALHDCSPPRAALSSRGANQPCTRPPPKRCPRGADAGSASAAAGCRAGLRRGSTMRRAADCNHGAPMTSSNTCKAAATAAAMPAAPWRRWWSILTSKMSDADVRAIAVYIKDLPAGAPEPGGKPAAAGGHGGGGGGLCPCLHRLPRGRRRRRAAGSIRRCPAMPICSWPIP